MGHRKYFSLGFGVLTVLILQACNLPFLSGGSGSAPAGSASGACYNPWEPVVTGARWSYAVTGPTASGPYTRTIQTVTSDAFTDQSVFSNGITRTGQWNCNQGALTAVDPFSADIATSNSAFVLTTTSTDGTGMPANFKTGDTFSMAYHMDGSATERGKTVPVKEDITESCTGGPMESVTVAAGTFNAFHISCTLGVSITMTINGSSYPTNVTSQAERWYVKNVGLVKSTDQSAAGLRVVVLTSYTLP